MEEMHLIFDLIPRLRRYARALTGDANAADDLVHDALERARAQLHLLPPQSDLRVWLYSLVNHAHASIGAAQAERAPPSELERAIAQLPHDQRAVLLLVCTEGLTYDEVAQVLGIPAGSAVSLLSSAREKLRALLGSEAVVRLKAIK